MRRPRTCRPARGARLLTADEAVELIVRGDHPEASAGPVALDALVVAGLRAGVLVACQHGDGRLSFTRTTGPATP